jgi:predicted GIY-YIG superfamily endonuclease
VSVVFIEERPNRDVALSREHQLKRWTRKKKNALLAGDLDRLKQL